MIGEMGRWGIRGRWRIDNRRKGSRWGIDSRRRKCSRRRKGSRRKARSRRGPRKVSHGIISNVGNCPVIASVCIVLRLRYRYTGSLQYCEVSLPIDRLDEPYWVLVCTRQCPSPMSSPRCHTTRLISVKMRQWRHKFIHRRRWVPLCLVGRVRKRDSGF
jgi:hypothetical protein